MKKQHNYSQEELTALQAHALELWNADNSHALELGKALLDVRAALERQHGAFKKWWQKHKLSQARVSYCMRLASGKVAAAKERRPTPEQIVISQVKKDVDWCLKYWANPNHSKTLDQIQTSIVGLHLRLISAVSGMRNWPIHLKDPAVCAAEKKFKCALTELLDAAFQPKDMGSPGWNREAPPAPFTPEESAQALKHLLDTRERGMPSTKPVASTTA